MKRSITLSLFLATTYLLHAQCEDLPLPTNAVVVTTSGTTNPPPGSVWVCGGLDVTIIADYTTIYVESGSTVQVIGKLNLGYMKGPGTLTTQCDTCFWSFEPTVTFVPMSGVLNLGGPCSPMSFDYSEAPSQGCPGITAVNELTAPAAQVQLRPNPATDRLTVQVTGAALRGLSVLDITGREVLRANMDPSGAYDVSALRAGSYIARVQTDRGMVTERFLKD